MNTADEPNTSPAFTVRTAKKDVPGDMRQRFTLNPKVARVIVGKSGIMVAVPADAFIDANGKAPEGKVRIELMEGLTEADVTRMNLGTMSQYGPLESGGMLYVNAYTEEGDALSIAPGKCLSIEIPTVNKKEGMEAWEGIMQPDGSLAWVNPQTVKDSLRRVPQGSLEAYLPEGVPVKGPLLVGDDKLVWRSSVGSPESIPLLSRGNGNYVGSVNLYDPVFKNTNIDTAEFRSRLQFIRQSCDTRVLFCYTLHPNRDLWKSDLEAADALDRIGCSLSRLFREFAKTGQCKAEPIDEDQVADLDKARSEAILNFSRLIYRDQPDLRSGFTAAYTFSMTKLGWMSCNRPMSGVNVRRMFFNVHVINPGSDVYQVALIIPGRNVFLAGTKTSAGDYTFTADGMLACPQGEHAYILVKAGPPDNFRFALKNIVFGSAYIETVILLPGTEEDLTQSLASRNDEPLSLVEEWNTRAVRGSKGACMCVAAWDTVRWSSSAG